MDNCIELDPLSDQVLSNAVVSVVLKSHKKELIDILKEKEDNQHYSIYFHFLLLLESQPKICNALLRDADSCLPTIDKALILSQQILYDSILAKRIDRLRRDRKQLKRTETVVDLFAERKIARESRKTSSNRNEGEEEDEGDDDELEFSEPLAILTVKKDIHFRIIGLPYTANEPYVITRQSSGRFPRNANQPNEGNFPKPRHFGLFLSIRGTVVKLSQTKMIERKKTFRCVRCNFSLEIQADYDQGYAIISPPHFEACQCDPEKTKRNKTNRFKPVEINLGPSDRKDFQEIKLQEPFDDRFAGSMTSYSMLVTLEDDLVDKCQPGDDVTITGQVLKRWSPLNPGHRCRIDLVFKANSIQVHNNLTASRQLNFRNCNIGLMFKNYWFQNAVRPLRARNQIISSFCPQVHGMYTVKLAMLIILAGGVAQRLESGVEIRGLSHMLLVGDPGIAKSKLLKYVARLCPRSVFTTGTGSTNAGLTASAIKENGQWHLEAGALVLADGGICCIDEFTTMEENERCAIHEAMEQQTVSISKAGIICRLKTRCSILAACNAKGGAYYDKKKSVSENCGIDRPLLTRFDLIFVLVDKNDRVWDEKVANHILRTKSNEEEIENEMEAEEENKNDSQRTGTEVLICSCGGACPGLCRKNFEKIDSTGGERNCSLADSSSISDHDNLSPDWVWSFEKLRSYLNLIKTFTPEFKPGAKRILSEYYLIKREEEQQKGSNTTKTTVRLLESLMRLAEGHARIMFREEVVITDALLVVHLMETSLMSNLFYKMSDGLHSTIPEDPTLEERINGQLIVDKMGLDYEKLERMDDGFDEHDFADYFFNPTQNNE